MRMTEARSLDSTSYFLIPLLDSTLTYSDFMTHTPLFVGTYTQNINLPWQDNHIFLLYKSNIDPTFNKLLKHLENNITFKWVSSIRLKGEWYFLLTFVRPIEYDLEISKLLNSRPTEISYNTKVKLISFWNLPVTSNLHKWLFQWSIPSIKIASVLGEQDLTLDKFELELFEATA